MAEVLVADLWSKDEGRPTPEVVASGGNWMVSRQGLRYRFDIWSDDQKIWRACPLTLGDRELAPLMPSIIARLDVDAQRHSCLTRGFAGLKAWADG